MPTHMERLPDRILISVSGVGAQPCHQGQDQVHIFVVLRRGAKFCFE